MSGAGVWWQLSENKHPRAAVRWDSLACCSSSKLIDEAPDNSQTAVVRGHEL